jgi:hypothetical protein
MISPFFDEMNGINNIDEPKQIEGADEIYHSL